MGLSLLFLSGNRLLKRIDLRIARLGGDIRKIEMMDNKLEAIIRFFQVIQSASYLSKEVAVLKRSGNKELEITSLESLVACLQGILQNGMNQTQKGEAVTAQTIYLQDMFGHSKHPVSYWLADRDNLEKSLHEDISIYNVHPISVWGAIHEYQCGSFIDKHVSIILEKIALLKGGNVKK